MKTTLRLVSLLFLVCLVISGFVGPAQAYFNNDPCYRAWDAKVTKCDNTWFSCCDDNWFACLDLSGCLGSLLTCETKADFGYFSCKFGGLSSPRVQGSYGPSGIYYGVLLRPSLVSIGDPLAPGLTAGAEAVDDESVILYGGADRTLSIAADEPELQSLDPREIVVTVRAVPILDAVEALRGQEAPIEVPMQRLGKARYDRDAKAWKVAWDPVAFADSRGYVIEVTFAGRGLPGGQVGTVALVYPTDNPTPPSPPASWGSIKARFD